jgi:hypothetical protein
MEIPFGKLNSNQVKYGKLEILGQFFGLSLSGFNLLSKDLYLKAFDQSM